MERAHRLVLVVLAGVGGLVVKELEGVVETNREDGTEDRTDPVDPVVVGERLSNNAGAQRSSGVDTSAGGEDGNQMANEERHSNGEGSHEGGSVLLDGEEQHGQTQLGSAEHLDPHSSGSGHTVTESVDEGDGAGGQGVGDTSSGHTGEELGDGQAQSSDGRNGTNKGEGESDTRVELTSGDSEEDEDVDEEGEAEAEGDHDDLGGVGAGDGFVVVGDGGNQVSEQQEHEGTDKLTNAGNEEVSHVLTETHRSRPGVGLIRGDVGGGGDGVHGLSGLRGGNGGQIVHRLLGHCQCRGFVLGGLCWWSTEREGCREGKARVYIYPTGVTKREREPVTQTHKHTCDLDTSLTLLCYLNCSSQIGFYTRLIHAESLSFK